MLSDRVRHGALVLLLIAAIAFLYLLHLHRDASLADDGTAEEQLPTAVERLLDIEPQRSPRTPDRPPPPFPQSVPVRSEDDALIALEPVMIGAIPVKGARFPFREEGDWLIAETARAGGREVPCDAIMRKGAARLAIGRCGGGQKK